MPDAAPTICRHPGCYDRGHGGYCPKHKKQRNVQRGSAHARGYDTDWRKLSKAKLEADPICEKRTLCNGAAATEVDHKIPIEDRPDLRLVWSNLESSCKPCHSQKTMMEMHRPRTRQRSSGKGEGGSEANDPPAQTARWRGKNTDKTGIIFF